MNAALKILSGHPTVKKATAALLTTVVGTLGTAMIDGNLTTGELFFVVGSGLVAASGVYKVENKKQ